MTPHNWELFVKTFSTKHPIKVHSMNVDDFKNISELFSLIEKKYN